MVNRLQIKNSHTSINTEKQYDTVLFLMYSCCCYVPDNFDVVTLTKLHHVVEGCLISDCVGKNCISIEKCKI